MGMKNSDTMSMAKTEVKPQAMTVMLLVYTSSFSPMMVAVLMLAKSKAPPENKNPRLRPARNRPFRVSAFCLRVLFQDIMATSPVKHKKLIMAIALMFYFAMTGRQIKAYDVGSKRWG